MSNLALTQISTFVLLVPVSVSAKEKSFPSLLASSCLTNPLDALTPRKYPSTAMKQINGMKYCPACHHTHTTDNYSRNKNASDGYYLYCKTCSRKIMKEYDARHKFRPIASAFNSKARRLGLPGILTAVDLQSVYDAQGGYCQNCKTDLLIQFDHIVSFWMRGDNLPDNLQLLCQRCNGHKGKYCIDYRQQ